VIAEFILERCVIFGRLGRHNEAIATFLHKLDRRIDLAEEYCLLHYEPAATLSVYSILFAELLVYMEQGSMTIQDILEFAVKNAQFVEMKEVLRNV
jgi:hypothetical protein